MRTLLPALGLLLLGLSPARADEVRLRDGRRLEGVLLEGRDAVVTLLLPDGEVLDLPLGDVAGFERTRLPPVAGQFTRYMETKTPAGGLRSTLETAVTYFMHPGSQQRVDLIAALHIADDSYYRRVQRHLDRVDRVLYEAVHASDMTAAEMKRRNQQSALGRMQSRLASWLGLVSQIDGIDYSRPHFVHADMTPEELGLSLEGGEASDEAPGSASGENATPAVRQFFSEVEAAAQISGWLAPLADLALGQGKDGGPLRNPLLKTLARLLARPDLPASLGGLEPELIETLLHKRNEKALEVLDQNLQPTGISLAIFYGAAHMEGLAAGLKARGFSRVGAEWIQAWTIE